jgi:hypothetical protein
MAILRYLIGINIKKQIEQLRVCRKRKQSGELFSCILLSGGIRIEGRNFKNVHKSKYFPCFQRFLLPHEMTRLVSRVTNLILKISKKITNRY